MKTFALCCKSFRRSVWRAAGVVPLTSPPVTMGTFRARKLEGYDFLYFKLHGLPGQPYWYGDRFLCTVLSAEQLRQADLSGAVVFVANCHLYSFEGGEYVQGPMLRALLDAGARAVVGGPGTNYAARVRVFGADLLGMVFRLALGTGRVKPAEALSVAKARLRQCRQDKVMRDTLEFEVFRGGS